MGGTLTILSELFRASELAPSRGLPTSTSLDREGSAHSRLLLSSSFAWLESLGQILIEAIIEVVILQRCIRTALSSRKGMGQTMTLRRA